MKVAAYIRVSTDRQTADNQLPAIKALCTARGWELVRVYAENESAWKAGHQAQWARAVYDAKHHHFEAIVVWALDRVSRQGAASILLTIKQLMMAGIRIISVQEPWTETDSSFNEVLYAIIGWVANFESNHRSERIRAGLAARREHGGGRRGKDKKPRRRGRWSKHPIPPELETAGVGG